MSSPHKKSQAALKAMKMRDILKLVAKHHLAKHIHPHRRLGKAALIAKLAALEHSAPAPGGGKPKKQKASPTVKPASSSSRPKRSPKPTKRLIYEV